MSSKKSKAQATYKRQLWWHNSHKFLRNETLTYVSYRMVFLMPVPKPKPKETEKEYISRCEKFMHEENQSKSSVEKRSNEQISAICYSTWRKKET